MKVINVFISYRRNDVAGYSGRISDALSSEFKVFFDTESIRLGDRFQNTIDQALVGSDLVLVILGKSCCSEFKARIDEVDYVVKEVSYARKLNKTILPITINREEVLSKDCFPEEIDFLAELNFYNIDHAKFSSDINFIKKEIFKRHFNLHTHIKNYTVKDNNHAFKNLELLLKSSKWECADSETTNLFLSETNRDKWFREKDALLLSCSFILSIDQLWIKYTEGRHGYSCQLGMLEQFSLSSDNPSDFIKFSEITQWKNNKEWQFKGSYEIYGSYPTPATTKKNISTNRSSFKSIIDMTKNCKEKYYG